jgi:hypothetical protein
MTNQEFNSRTAAYMKNLADDSALKFRALPDPDLLWMKAQLMDRQAKMEKVLRPVETLNAVLRILIGCAVCWLAIQLIAGWTTTIAESVPHIWISLAISVAISIAAIAAYPVWAGE